MPVAAWPCLPSGVAPASRDESPNVFTPGDIAHRPDYVVPEKLGALTVHREHLQGTL